ncbi:MAG: DUF6090 family protein [Melioribacteraceae bacterium]|nr:DUF6090 family protein [Melioribacteraceae bacterium]
MLTFFRRIRKGLLGSGATRKYFLYAVGEIALVVIGILIALQINNWNEWRKERVLEKIVLEDIKDNIERNDELIRSAIETIDQINRSTYIVKKHIQMSLAYSDTLSYHTNQALRSGTFLFKLNFDGYESLKSTGFNIIKNEELKDEILSLFEVTYGYILTTLNFANSFYLDDLSWWKEYFYKNDLDNYIPYNKENILDEKRFLTEINDIAFLRGDFQTTIKESLPKSKNVLTLIEDELK